MEQSTNQMMDVFSDPNFEEVEETSVRVAPHGSEYRVERDGSITISIRPPRENEGWQDHMCIAMEMAGRILGHYWKDKKKGWKDTHGESVL